MMPAHTWLGLMTWGFSKRTWKETESLFTVLIFHYALKTRELILARKFRFRWRGFQADLQRKRGLITTRDSDSAWSSLSGLDGKMMADSHPEIPSPHGPSPGEKTKKQLLPVPVVKRTVGLREREEQCTRRLLSPARGKTYRNVSGTRPQQLDKIPGCCQLDNHLQYADGSSENERSVTHLKRYKP